ncbi:MAG: glutamate-1-semialdehyde 2,1-aminomutase [bacterium]|jgi:glutamate-1-semialdehyde 2,1-aminomutase|nr:glutamate-1-semialdehyde 2,1-aminomutase [SAR324 cluster bacterium]
MKISESKKLFSRAQEVMPGGVNSPVRAFKSVQSEPLFITHAKGSRLFDADGNSFIDYIGSWGPMILGHADPRITSEIEKAVQKGTSFGTPTEGEIELAEMISDAVQSVEMVRLVNSGSEAAMAALRVARGFTGRDKIIKFEGCYHGSVDALLVKAGSGATTLGIPDSPGVPQSFTEHTLSAPFNDLDAVIELTENFPDEIAAIVLEPVAGNMGMIPPEHGFLQGLRELCDREGILLIFDEVMTGFRVDFSGAQALFQVMPDLSIFGKVIGGGLPVGAYGGRREIMLQVAPAGPVYQAGTLSGNPIAVSAGKTMLKILKEEDPYADLGRKTATLNEALSDAAKKKGIPLETCSMGGMFGFFFSEKKVRNYEDALKCNRDYFITFFREVLSRGIYLAPSPFESLFLSSSHSEADLDQTIEAFQHGLAAI